MSPEPAGRGEAQGAGSGCSGVGVVCRKGAVANRPDVTCAWGPGQLPAALVFWNSRQCRNILGCRAQRPGLSSSVCSQKLVLPRSLLSQPYSPLPSSLHTHCPASWGWGGSAVVPCCSFLASCTGCRQCPQPPQRPPHPPKAKRGFRALVPPRQTSSSPTSSSSTQATFLSPASGPLSWLLLLLE